MREKERERERYAHWWEKAQNKVFRGKLSLYTVLHTIVHVIIVFWKHDFNYNY